MSWCGLGLILEWYRGEEAQLRRIGDLQEKLRDTQDLLSQTLAKTEGNMTRQLQSARQNKAQGCKESALSDMKAFMLHKKYAVSIRTYILQIQRYVTVLEQSVLTHQMADSMREFSKVVGKANEMADKKDAGQDVEDAYDKANVMEDACSDVAGKLRTMVDSLYIGPLSEEIGEEDAALYAMIDGEERAESPTRSPEPAGREKERSPVPAAGQPRATAKPKPKPKSKPKPMVDTSMLLS
jgi:hypothetical protein